MPISYPEVLDATARDVASPWTAKDAILYALGVGAGCDPNDEVELPFVFEERLVLLPTFSSVIAHGRSLTPKLGLDLSRVLAGEHRTTLHRPLPPASAEAVTDSRVAAVYDKGEGKGAVVVLENILRERPGGDILVTITKTLFARGDGGCGAPVGGPEPHRMPSRAPDMTIDIPTRPEQALLYRLSGDLHHLHVDPAYARRAGFSGPILHGLCSYGISGRAVMKAFGNIDPEQISSHAARFSGVIYPGETISLEMWREGDEISFEGFVLTRDAKVLQNGQTLLRTT